MTSIKTLRAELLGFQRRSWMAAVLMLGGCGTARPLHTSFDRLTNESASTASALLNYSSFVSVSGLAPLQAIGSMEHSPRSLQPSHAIGISPRWSYVVQTDYKLDEASGASPKSVKEKYLQNHADAVHLATLTAEVTQLEAITAQKSNATLSKFAAALGLLCDTDCGAPVGAHLINRKKALLEARNALAASSAQLAGILERSNVIVTRWDVNEGKSTAIDVAGVGALQGERSSDLRGVAIFGGIRTIKLYAGDDFLDMINNFSTSASYLSGVVGITTYAVLAQEVEYISDQDMSFQAAMNASLPLDKLNALAEIIGGKTANIGAGIGGASSLGNSGRLVNPVTEVMEFSFFPRGAHEEYIKASHRENSGYSTIYAVKGTFPVILSLLNSKMAKTDFGRSDGPALAALRDGCMSRLKTKASVTAEPIVQEACTYPQRPMP